MCVEKVGEAGRGDGGDGGGLVVEAWDEDDGLEGQGVGFDVGRGSLALLEFQGEAFDG